MTVLLEYIDLFGRAHASNNYSSALSHNYLMHAINHCYQVGQYLKHHAQNDIKLC